MNADLRASIVAVAMASSFLALVADARAASDEGASCSLRGRFTPSAPTRIFAARTGNTAIAQLSSMWSTDVEIEAIPADADGRAFVRTGLGGRSMQLEGYIDAASIVARLAHKVTIAKDHFYLSAGSLVRVRGASQGHVVVELVYSELAGVIGQAECSDVTLGRVDDPPLQYPPVRFTGELQLKGNTLPLYAAPNVPLGIVLSPPDGSVLDLYGIGTAGSFTHVVFADEAYLDAWVQSSALVEHEPAFVCGNGLLGAMGYPPQHGPMKRLALADAPLRLEANDAATTIGVLQRGAIFFVKEARPGWLRVVLEHEPVAPAEGGAFWVKTKELASVVD